MMIFFLKEKDDVEMSGFCFNFIL